MKNKSKGDFAILFFVKDWLTSTASMSADCRGWYINLLCHNHDKGELPNDIEQLAILASVKFSDYERFTKGFEKELRSKFIATEDNTLTNPKLEEIMQTRQRFTEKRTASGKMGVLVKTAKMLTDNSDEIEYLKSQFEEAEEYLSDREKLKQVLKQMLKLYRNRDKNKEEDINGVESFPFEMFWNLYDKKVGKMDKIEKKWYALSKSDQKSIMLHIPQYKSAQPDKKFRKNPETYLNNRSWEDEIISSDNGLMVGQKTEQKYDKKRSY